MGLIRHLKDSEPFNALPEDIFAQLSKDARTETYPAHHYIFHHNDPPTGYLYVIRSGIIEIVVHTPGGEEMVLDYRKEGQFFGGTPIFSGGPYTGGARTSVETVCFLVPAESLKEAARKHPRISEYFTRIVLSRVRNLYSEIVAEHSSKALTQMEAYPFKKRLSEIMTAPVETCGPGATVKQVAQQMADKKVDALLVTEKNRKILGIITERDLVAKVVASDNDDCRSLLASEVMTPHPHALKPDTFMYEAMAYLTGHRIRHLPVVDGERLVGIVTLRDLMRFRSQKAMLLIGSIREERDLSRLADIRREVVTVARSLLSETRSTPEVMEILSYIHHRLIRRVFDLVLEAYIAEGNVQPDIRYCFLLMGSGGRREMLLGPDQDNGFIYEDVADARVPELEAFFNPLAERLTQAFAEVGYPLCDGEVMVNNPAWRGRLSDWQERLADWVNNPEPQKVRYSTIFFDFVPLAGDTSLAEDLRELVHRLLSAFPGFLYHMMTLDLRHKAPVSLLGRFITEKSGRHKGMLSLKQGGLVYLVDCIRMFALEQELEALSTMERLDALVESNVFSAETAEHIRAAFEALSFLRLRNEIELVSDGKEPCHFLDPQRLSRTEQDLLKESFNAVSKLQDATKRHFARTPF